MIRHHWRHMDRESAHGSRHANSTSSQLRSITFSRPAEFHKTLYARVRAHLKEQGIPRTGGVRIALKMAFIFALLFSSYYVLVFRSDALWVTILSTFLLSQAIVLIGFNVMHDAGHGSFSKKKWVNKTLGLSLDLIGGNQWLWGFKHGVLHHTYTNLETLDDDLDSRGIIRTHPDQPWKPYHRYQAIYALPLYGLLYVLWFFDDFAQFFGRNVGGHATTKPTWKETTLLLVFKVNFVTWGLVVPMILYPWYWVLLVFMSIQMVVGLTLAIVFQLAHVVDGVAMPSLEGSRASIEDQWAAHQVRTTANFATGNPLVRWYAGGLNFQIEHHLFANISHVRYRHIQPIVQKTCVEFGVPYQCYPTVRSAIKAHIRQLVAMGRKPEVA